MRKLSQPAPSRRWAEIDFDKNSSNWLVARSAVSVDRRATRVSQDCREIESMVETPKGFGEVAMGVLDQPNGVHVGFQGDQQVLLVLRANPALPPARSPRLTCYATGSRRLRRSRAAGTRP